MGLSAFSHAPVQQAQLYTAKLQLVNASADLDIMVKGGLVGIHIHVYLHATSVKMSSFFRKRSFPLLP